MIRPIDTSQLGPIRIVPQDHDQAAELFARQLERRGTAWRNTANSVRAGFRNMWIEAGIAAIAALLPMIDDHERLSG